MPLIRKYRDNQPKNFSIGPTVKMDAATLAQLLYDIYKSSILADDETERKEEYVL